VSFIVRTAMVFVLCAFAGIAAVISAIRAKDNRRILKLLNRRSVRGGEHAPAKDIAVNLAGKVQSTSTLRVAEWCRSSPKSVAHENRNRRMR
jgi:hypothetical protein